VTDEITARRLARLGGALRERGVPVSVKDELDAARALPLVDTDDRAEVRRALGIALKVPHRVRDLFAQLFDALWLDDGTPEDGRHGRVPRTHGMQRRGGTFPRWNAERATIEEDEGPETEGDAPGWSPAALLRAKPLPECTPRDLAELDRVLAAWARRLATLRSRRLVATAGRGTPDLRRSFGRALRTRGEIVSLAARRRALEVPRIVFLCDTSGSMGPYARFLLSFALSLRRVAHNTEVFAFNTSLHRLTRWLAPARLAFTLERLAEGVPDWGGGTRIGDCLAEFVDKHLARTVDGRTVVVILSDGLDRGDPDRLREAMRRIRARARRVVWLNPLLHDPRYRPEARGMEAALPFVDRFAPAHDAASLERLLPDLVA
jgi:uncharacterized protein with von Willebrand factor type A (vWA) domain